MKILTMNKILQFFEHLLNNLMFFLVIGYLFVFALWMQYSIAEKFKPLIYEPQIIQIISILWYILVLERFSYLIFCQRRTWQIYTFTLATILLPPLRLVARRCHDLNSIWLFSWQAIDEKLYEYLEKLFLYPIFFLSLLMVPFWLMEIFFPEEINVYRILYHFVNVGNALIWELFLIEFLLMFTITEKRWEYLKNHWLELFIIILPLLAILRGVFIAKQAYLLKRIPLLKYALMLQVAKLQQMMNIYRARSMLGRVVRLLIIVDIFKRFYRRHYPEKYLLILQKQLSEREQELVDLKQQIAEIEELIAKKHP
jgi:hypothetical protein